jgi:hypothetical protein
MKMTNNIMIAALAGVMLSSCDSFLDRYPYSENSSKTMFTSSVLAESVVTGAYSNLLYDYNSTANDVLNWDALGTILDASEGIASLNYTFLFGTVNASNSMFSTYWKRFYEGVNRANDVINNISQVPDMSDDDKACRIAECKFLRAFHYYRLNALWRGVPIYEENLAPDEYTRARSSEEEVWRFIIQDCTDCINTASLPDKYASSNSDYGRVTRGAAYMLRGKTYLWLKEYAAAEADFRKVGECGYSLYNGAYADLFTEANERCSEMIFSVQMVEQSDNGNAFSNNYGNYCTTGYGKYHQYVNVNFADSFEEKDGTPFDWDNYLPDYSTMTPDARSVYFLRNSLTETEKNAMTLAGADMSKYDDAGNEERVKAAYANRDPRLAALAITPYATYVGGASGSAVTYTNRFPYRDWLSPSFDLRYSNNADFLYAIRKFVTKGREYTNITYNPIDVPIFRYADALLCLAEALNEQGKWQDAVPYVNQVRSRAGVALLNGGNAALNISSSAELRTRIYKEKKWELAAEEQVYLDELRWGTWKDEKFVTDNGLQNVWGSPVYTYSWGGNAYLKWAVPQSETEKNTNIVQNEYWY